MATLNIDSEAQRNAARTVAHHAIDAADTIRLLDMLGIPLTAWGCTECTSRATCVTEGCKQP